MKVVVLTGGVGGAKLVLGLTQILPASDIVAIVNTGDDFHHLGLYIAPDIDTLLYTLSGKSDRERGWGRNEESWNFMSALRELGGEDWFMLGDGDLALHILRTARLSAGDSLTDITQAFAAAWDIGIDIRPMSNDTVRTWLDTDEGRLEFQRYFVGRHCEPRTERIDFVGAAAAQPAPGVMDAIARADLILIAPSNPYLSIDPILAVPGIRQALRDSFARVVGVSPLIGGRAVKGPTAKLMAELNMEVCNRAIAAHYGDLLDGLLIDSGDEGVEGIEIARTDTMMHTLNDRIRVAKAALALGQKVARV